MSNSPTDRLGQHRSPGGAAIDTLHSSGLAHLEDSDKSHQLEDVNGSGSAIHTGALPSQMLSSGSLGNSNTNANSNSNQVAPIIAARMLSCFGRLLRVMGTVTSMMRTLMMVPTEPVLSKMAAAVLILQTADILTTIILTVQLLMEVESLEPEWCIVHLC